VPQLLNTMRFELNNLVLWQTRPNKANHQKHFDIE